MTVKSTLGGGRPVRITNFGTFEVTARPGRRGVNPSSGEKLFIPAPPRLELPPGTQAAGPGGQRRQGRVIRPWRPRRKARRGSTTRSARRVRPSSIQPYVLRYWETEFTALNPDQEQIRPAGLQRERAGGHPAHQGAPLRRGLHHRRGQETPGVGAFRRFAWRSKEAAGSGKVAAAGAKGSESRRPPLPLTPTPMRG